MLEVSLPARPVASLTFSLPGGFFFVIVPHPLQIARRIENAVIHVVITYAFEDRRTYVTYVTPSTVSWHSGVETKFGGLWSDTRSTLQ